MLFLLTALTPAHAYLFGGTPDIPVDVEVDNVLNQYTSGSVLLDKVRVYACNGSYLDYNVGLWVDPVAGHTEHIQGGDLCGIRYYFGSAMTLHGVNSNGAFTVVFDEPFATVDIDPEIANPAITPYTVTQGTTSIAPHVYLSM